MARIARSVNPRLYPESAKKRAVRVAVTRLCRGAGSGRDIGGWHAKSRMVSATGNGGKVLDGHTGVHGVEGRRSERLIKDAQR